MSTVSTGNEGWMWLTFLRLAEPLMKRVDDVIADEPEAGRMLGLASIDGPTHAVGEYEDAERWDGMS